MTIDGGFSDPCGASHGVAQRFRSLFQGVLVHVHSPRQFHRVALDADGLQSLRGLGFRCLSGLVGVESEPHAFHLCRPDRLEEFGGEVRGAEGASRRFHAVADEGQRIEDAFGQDDFALFERLAVEGAAERPREVKMPLVLRRRRADPPSVKLHDIALDVAHRHHQTAVQVFASGLAIYAEGFEPFADLRALLAVLAGDPQAERPVGQPDAEALPQLRVIEAAAFEVVAGRFAFVSRKTRGLVVRDLLQQLPSLRRVLQRTRQARHRQPASLGFLRRVLESGLAAVGQQLEGMAEAHPVEALHELDRVARRPAAARHAAEKPLPRRRDQVRRLRVVVKRAKPGPVRSLLPQTHSARLDQRNQRRPSVSSREVSIEELLGVREGKAKRGPVPKLQKQFQAIGSLPKSKQDPIARAIDALLAQEGAVA